jgi:hypothetical protein
LNIKFRDRHPTLTRTMRRGSSNAERVRTETLLGRYPELDPSEIAELKGWFLRRATAADVALLACNERLNPNFRAFRRLHIEPFTWWQKAVVAAVSVLPLALLGVVLLGDG